MTDTLAIVALIVIVPLSWFVGSKLRDALLRFIERDQRRRYLRIGKRFGIEEREGESNEELCKRLTRAIDAWPETARETGGTHGSR